MEVIGLRTSIWHNRMRLWYLISLLPLLVVVVVFFYLYFTMGEMDEVFWNTFTSVSGIGVVVMLVRVTIGVFFQKKIIFGFTGAKEVTRIEYPKVYNIVENLCISRGLPIPKIGIIPSSGINAFATGWNPKNSWIVFSTGLLDMLDEKEIEAVAGHELTHIINGDVKHMVIINVFIGAIGTIGYILMRTRGKKNPLSILGLALYILSLVLLPLINLAISRKKEFLADAGSVELTHDKLAMISALKKITENSYIEQLDSRSSAVASMFIDRPKKSIFFKNWFKGLRSTHPPIEERIKALELY